MYGGYQVNHGPLNDFIYVDLEEPDSWKKIELEEDTLYPGFLSRHTSVIIDDDFLIFGGQESINKSSNKLYKYNFITKKFTLSEASNVPEPTDSHCACVYDVMGKIEKNDHFWRLL